MRRGKLARHKAATGKGERVLQIATGKLFRLGKARENALTATLFSNSSRMFNELVIKAGTVAWTNALGTRTPSLVYKVNEAIEGDAGPLEEIQSVLARQARDMMALRVPCRSGRYDSTETGASLRGNCGAKP